MHLKSFLLFFDVFPFSIEVWQCVQINSATVDKVEESDIDYNPDLTHWENPNTRNYGTNLHFSASSYSQKKSGMKERKSSPKHC